MGLKLKLPITVANSLNILFITIFTGSMIGVIAYLNTQNAIDDLSRQLFAQSSARVTEKIEAYMKVPQQLNRMNAEDIISYHTADLALKGHLAGQLFSDLKHNPSVISIEYASEDLDYVGPVRNVMDVEYAIGFATKESGNTFELFQTDSEGNILKKIYELPDYDSRTTSWYQKAVEAKKPTWTDIYVWLNGDIGLDAVYPLYLEDKLYGVIDTSIRLTELRKFISDSRPTVNSRVAVIDSNKKVVVATDLDKPYVKEGDIYKSIKITETDSPLYTAAMQEIVDSERKITIPTGGLVSKTFSLEGEIYLLTATQYSDEFGLSWYILMVTPRNDFLSKVNRNRMVFGAFIVLGALIALAIGIINGRLITAPITELNRVAQRYAAGDLDARPEITAKNEIGDLAATFTYMSNKIKKSMLSLKEKEQLAIDKQEEYRAERDKVEAILQSIGDGVFVIDSDQRVVMINPVALRISGYSKAEIIGKDYRETLRFEHEMKPNVINEGFVQKAFFTRKVQEMSNHTVLITKSGERIPVADSAAPLLDENDEVYGCVLVFRDVTQERAIDKAKTEFVSLASHQLRTPLTSIAWNTELLTSALSTTGLTKVQRELIEGIGKGNQRMIALVNALLDTSHFELGIFDKNIQKLKLPHELKVVLAMLQGTIEEKKLTVKTTIKPHFPVYLGDQRLVNIILLNILSNAVKYTPAKGTVLIDLSYTKFDIIFTVKDSGIGISKAQQANIFEKLFRADNARAAETDGTGLGLYLAKAIVDSAEGSISFTSDEGTGTTFTVKLPLKGM